jgi:hypothetical protein
MNRRGFLKIVEATIAILIIFGALLIISSPREVQKPKDLTETLPPLLEEVAKNQTLRTKIVKDYDVNNQGASGNEPIINEIVNFLKPRVANPAFNFTIRVCSLEDRCALVPYPDVGEVYVSERVISSVIGESNFNPKKIKIFLWRRP